MSNYFIIEASSTVKENRVITYVREISSDNFEFVKERNSAKRFNSYNDAYEFLYYNNSKSPEIKGLNRSKTYLPILMY